MHIERLDTRKGELAIGAAFMVVAAIWIAEATRLGAGWGPAGPEPGFFPRLAAVIMGITAAVAVVQALRSGTSKPLFESADKCREVFRVGGPMAAAVCALGFLGFYPVTALYMGLFSWWYGRYRWFYALAVAIAVPAVLFFTFERGFKILLPKSMWYASGLLPF